MATECAEVAYGVCACVRVRVCARVCVRVCVRVHALLQVDVINDESLGLTKLQYAAADPEKSGRGGPSQCRWLLKGCRAL